ncbi:hypothetical protein PAXRUDRAFT_151492 [Paxillus rubicundulus Ve08.2h10]|uniref:Uncharacterized protein n=1 Tax=Paxillus rubicundulus Ve08.2h10 TaxID=930991 RepID=A0A0D0D2A4_9AGAM|nr:hypothetical protein PAXRUDRAFT_151492 [Paxillus rubicundulus Ve08.2h10]
MLLLTEATLFFFNLACDLIRALNANNSLVCQVRDWATIVNLSRSSSILSDISSNSTLPTASMQLSHSVSTKATTASYCGPPPSIVPNLDKELMGGFGNDKEENDADPERATALLLSMKIGKLSTQGIIKVSLNSLSDGLRVGDNLKIKTPTLKWKEPELDYTPSSEVKFGEGGWSMGMKWYMR